MQRTGLPIHQIKTERLSSGEEVRSWHVAGPTGSGFTCMELGATITSVNVPDKKGAIGNVALSLDSAQEYFDSNDFIGAVIGRFANRIAGARFILDGKTYDLEANDGKNTLHGGTHGFQRRIWHGSPYRNDEGQGLSFTLESADGDQGFPGRLTVTVTYIWTDDNNLIVDFSAETDRPTPFNVTQHSYWNLHDAGGTAPICDHVLSIIADAYLPISDDMIPTGEYAHVGGTEFDFRAPRKLGVLHESKAAQIQFAHGFDHCYILNSQGLRKVARLHDPVSGRSLTVLTDQPGMHFYSGNFLGMSQNGWQSGPNRRYCGLALETQHFPNSPNVPSFPATILYPGQPFHSRTVFGFDAGNLVPDTRSGA